MIGTLVAETRTPTAPVPRAGAASDAWHRERIEGQVAELLDDHGPGYVTSVHVRGLLHQLCRYGGADIADRIEDCAYR